MNGDCKMLFTKYEMLFKYLLVSLTFSGFKKPYLIGNRKIYFVRN